MIVGDIILLIGQLSRNALENGRFFYAGYIVSILPSPDFDLSRKLWGNEGFPLIFFMQGNLVDYSWLDFGRDFNFAPSYFLAGSTMRIEESRLAASVYCDTATLSTRLGLRKVIL